MTRTRSARPIAPRCIAFVVFDDIVALDLAGPLEAFSIACRNPELGGHVPYDLRIVSESGGLIRSRSGLSLATEPLSSLDRRPIDTLVVAGGGPGVPDATTATLTRWLRRRAPKARRVASVCTGAFALGAAGLLSGKHATTHWRALDLLAETYPSTIVERGPIYVRDGKLWTAAGVTAGIDLALALIEDDLGHKAAIDVAQMLVVFLKRPGDQAQFSVPLKVQVRAENRFAGLLRWVSENLEADLTVDALAARLNMTPRTFARLFVAQVGESPARLVAQLRLEAAQRMLAEGELPLKDVARLTGHGSMQNLQRAIRHTSAITPGDYRERFGSRRPE